MLPRYNRSGNIGTRYLPLQHLSGLHLVFARVVPCDAGSGVVPSDRKRGAGQTWTTCSSEPVLLDRSAAARRAKMASSEPSVAARILVGKLLIVPLLSDLSPKRRRR